MKQKNNVLGKILTSQIFIDIVTIIACSACSLICIYLFQQDLNATLIRQGETPIGTITYKNNLVQRQFIDRLIWDRLRKEAPVYNGDLIRTADLSEAVIAFEFGDIAELQSNTMVQIFTDHTGVRIDFARGGINILSGSQNGVVVTSGDMRITIDPGAVIQAFSLGNGGLDLSVSEGEAFLESLFGESEIISLEQGSAVRYDASGQRTGAPIAAPVYPSSGAQFLTNDDAVDIPFVWNKVNYGEDVPTRLEISYDRNFKRMLYSGDTEGINQIRGIPEGMWFWRVYPANTAPSATGPYSRLTIIKTKAPELISPLAEQKIDYRSRAPSVRFQWTASPQAVSYKLEAANNAQFINPVINAQARATAASRESFVTSALGEGSWYWRVTPVYGNQTGAEGAGAQSSETGYFSISSNRTLSAPVLSSPQDNAFVNIETARRDILFSWKRNNEAESYTIRISANSNMSSPVIEHTTTETVYRYRANETAISVGAWHWTVQFTASDGTLSPVSQPRAFNAIYGELVQRLVFPPDNYTVADNFLSDTRFTWKTNLLENRFQVSRLENFSQLLIDEPAVTESYTIRFLPQGDYYWRISGAQENRTQAGQSRRFTVTGSLPPSAALAVDSGVSAQIGDIVIRPGREANFNWQPVENAEYYVFKMHRGDSSTAPILETIVYGTSISINMENYEEGLHTWSVQGLARASQESSRRTGLTATQGVNLRHLRPAIIEHPRDGFTYEGLDASRRPDTARWLTQEYALNTNFVLARDSEMRDIAHSFPVSVLNFTLPRLNAGDYYWRITAETAEAYDISSQIAHFRVLPIPLLPAPSNRIPQDRYTITARDVQTARSVNFSWNSVQGANAYIVSVFQGSGRTRRTVIESEPITGNSYQIEDIRLLGRGTFTWQVEAVNILDEDFIEQRGTLQENRLTIDIPAPRQVNPRDSGTLYGM